MFAGKAGKVFRGMATLAVGSGVAQAVSLLSIPFVTRIYSPADYGVLAVYTSLVMILSPLLTLRYVLAMPLPKTDGIAMNVLVLSAGLMLAMSLIVGVFFWAFGPTLLGILSMEILVPWWWLIVVGLIISAGSEILGMWATRKRAYKTVAQTQVAQSVTGAVLKIGLGVLGFRPFGLLLGQIVTIGGGIGMLLLRFRSELRTNFAAVSRKRLWLVTRRYRTFPFYRLPSQFLLMFAMQGPALMAAAVYDAATAGQLGLALMAMALPTTLLSNSMSKAYYAEISAIGRRSLAEIKELTHSVIHRLFWISIPPAVILFLLGPQIFSFVFGDEWALAGEIASLLSIYLAFQFVQAPVAHVFYVLEKQGILLYLSIQRVVITFGCFAAGYKLGLDITETILVYAVALSLHYVFTVYRALKAINV